MAVDAQVRPDLGRAVQQVANLPIAALVALQLETFTAAGQMSGDKDVAFCDASDGTFTLTLPGGANVVVGKPYVVKEWEGSNDVTIDAAGSGTIDGSANLTLAAGESVTMVARSVDSSTLVVTWEVIYRTAAGSDTSAIHTTDAGEIMAVTLKASPVAADEILIEDSASDPVGEKKSATIGSLPIAQAQVSSTLLVPAADAAVELTATTGGVQLTVSGTDPVAISTNANCYAGQKVHLFAVAVSGGGSYTLALDVGTLTLNAAGESAVVMRNSGNTAWVCVGLSGATIV